MSNKYTVRDDNTNSTIKQSPVQNPGEISLCSPADLSWRTKGFQKLFVECMDGAAVIHGITYSKADFVNYLMI